MKATPSPTSLAALPSHCFHSQTCFMKLNAQHAAAAQIDRLGKEHHGALDRLDEGFRRIMPFEATFPLSARHGHGVAQLREHLLSRCAQLCLLPGICSLPRNWSCPETVRCPEKGTAGP
jgi:hypothetical protein